MAMCTLSGRVLVALSILLHKTSMMIAESWTGKVDSQVIHQQLQCVSVSWIHLLQPLEMVGSVLVKDVSKELIDFGKVGQWCLCGRTGEGSCLAAGDRSVQVLLCAVQLHRLQTSTLQRQRRVVYTESAIG